MNMYIRPVISLIVGIDHILDGFWVVEYLWLQHCIPLIFAIVITMLGSL